MPDESVFQAQHAFLDLEASVGTHRAVAQMEAALMQVPSAVAALVSAQARQVALLPSASRGFATALSAVAPDRLVEVFVTRQEWAAHLMCISVTLRATLRVVEQSSQETLTAAFARALSGRDRHRVAVVSVPLLPSHSGLCNDLEGLASVVRDARGWLFVDASQAVGQQPVSFERSQADVMVFPARKWLRGPRGIAALVLSDRALDEFGPPAAPDIHGTQWLDMGGKAPRLTHGSGAARFQPYEHHPALRLGLTAAVKVLNALGTATVQERICERASALRQRLATVASLQVEQDANSGLVCMRFPRPLQHEYMVRELWSRGIHAAAIGARYAPLLMGAHDSLIRMSPHAITTDEEIEVTARALEHLAS
ncbi:MAG: aminotransferase class V-fold PLP-dependent enzyme [Chitinophagaceae bacterium]|nr:aminotransferase class V-fold PLP-dependent enzyme [Rubrivivax sp.]